MMKTIKISVLWLSLSMLAACSVMPATQSGFLSQWPQGVVSGGTLPKVVWRVNAGHDISKQEQEELKGLLTREINIALNKANHDNKIPSQSIQIRAAITRIEAVSPALNWLTTILLFVPMDHGGAAVELQAIDVRTEKVITQLRFARWTPISELRSHFTRLAPANLALTLAAHEFVDQLTEVH